MAETTAVRSETTGVAPPTKAWAAFLDLRVVTAAAVLARLAYVFVLSGTKLSDDEISFWTIAGNVARGRGYTFAGAATAWRPPLYTFALAGARWAGLSIRTVEVGQALVGAATPVLFYLLARRLGASGRAATLAAWIGALYPPFVYFAGRILSENLAIPLYVLALWVTVEWLRRGGIRWAALAGLAWGLSILARPTSIPIAVLAVAVGVVAVRTGRRAVEGVLILALAAVCVLPWAVRNASAVGGPEPVASNEGFTLWVSNRLDTGQLKDVLDTTRYPGIQDYSVYGRMFPGIEALAREKGFAFDQAGEAARDAWFRGLALHAIGQRPLRFIGRSVERALYVLIPAPSYASQTARTGTAATAVLWVTSGPVIVLGFVGAAVLPLRRRRPEAWFLALAVALAMAFVAIHVAYVRYRVDGVDALLVPPAAWLVADLVRIPGRRAAGRPA